MGFNATWSMAVGGMVGGGIFSVLGVVVALSGQWAWLSFLVAGLIAFCSAHSYSRLADKFSESGGSFTFLRKINHEGFAGSLSWVLILGYILTISVYAFTFGHYVAHAFSLGKWVPRACALAVIVFLTFINLRGVGESSRLEIITVWGKLIVLIGLAIIGIIHWSPGQLTSGIGNKSIGNALMGAAVIFMAYEGFQLLTYDYDEIRNPQKNLPLASLTAVVSVIIIYIMVTLGAVMLVGAGTIVDQKEVALSVAGSQALGLTGLILVTIAAAFSTASAINATLFSTARLMQDVAQRRDLPDLLTHENKEEVPIYAIFSISVAAAVLASIGSLGDLVESASLVFLFTFGTVNFIAYNQSINHRWISLAGAIGSTLAIMVSVWRQVHHSLFSFICLTIIILLAVLGRPLILKRIN